MQPCTCTVTRGVNWTVDCFLLHQVVLSGHNKAVDALAFSSPSPSSATLLCSASADAILLWNLDKLEPSAGNISRGERDSQILRSFLPTCLVGAEGTIVTILLVFMLGAHNHRNQHQYKMPIHRNYYKKCVVSKPDEAIKAIVSTCF